MSIAPAYDSATRANYAALWQRMTVLEGRKAAVAAVARRVLGSKARYLTIEKQTGIPWWWVGITHYREANCNFHCHLHNGDPLTGRTRHVPADRPRVGEPPFTWEESALDALKLEGLDRVSDWSIVSAAYRWEAYNGWGYHARGVTSAYLWAASNDHEQGKFTSDGHYDPSAGDAQEGTMPVLQCLMALDPTVRLTLDPQKPSVVRPMEAPATQVAPKRTPAPGPSQAPTEGPAKTSTNTPLAVLIGTITSMLTAVGQAMDSLKPILGNPWVIGALVVVASVTGLVILFEHWKK